MKSLILLVVLTLTSISFADLLPLGDARVEVKETGEYSITYIGGEAAKALYSSMTYVNPIDGDGIDSKVTIKKGPALECTEDIYMGGTDYTCIISINNDGSVRPYSPEKVCEYPIPVDCAN